MPLLALLVAGCAPQTSLHSAVQPAENSLNKQTQAQWPAVLAFAENAVSSGRVQGISIAVALGSDPPTYISAGNLGLEPRSRAVSPDSLWRIYSMTKPITGIAAMILVEEGKLRLDQPVSDFIPSFASSRVLTDPGRSLASRPASRPITIRDLLTHSSGLNYATFGNGQAFDKLKQDGLVPLMLNRTSELELRPLRPASLAEFGDRAGRSALIADPGMRFSYSMGLDVLAAVIEKASGMPFERFLDRRLFKPLGMRSTYWQVPEAESYRLAINYVSKNVANYILSGTVAASDARFVQVDGNLDSVYLEKPSFPYGGSGLVSSARDYDRFLQMLAGHGKLGAVRVLRPETVDLAMSNLLPNGVLLKNFGPIPTGEATGFGAGGFVTIVNVDGYGRSRGTYGWDGAAGSRAWTDPVRHIRATMMINLIGAPNVGSDFDKAVAKDFALSVPNP